MSEEQEINFYQTRKAMQHKEDLEGGAAARCLQSKWCGRCGLVGILVAFLTFFLLCYNQNIHNVIEEAKHQQELKSIIDKFSRGLLIDSASDTHGENQHPHRVFGQSHHSNDPNNVAAHPAVHAEKSHQVDEIVIDVPHCDCKKTIHAKYHHEAEENFGSTEEEDATEDQDIENHPENHFITCNGYSAIKRGKHQKIISYSIENFATRQNIGENLKILAEQNANLKVGWLMRIHHNLTASEFRKFRIPNSNDTFDFCQLECQFEQLDFCNVTENLHYGNIGHLSSDIWRLLPVADEQVSVASIRTTDRIVSVREASAVKEWLSTPYFVHAMHDHPDQLERLPAYMWDLKVSPLRPLLQNLMNEMIANPRVLGTNSNVGKYLTNQYIWSWAHTSFLEHDSYHCALHEHSLAFPTRRKNKDHNFAGALMVANNSIWMKCPEQCRPKHHKEWEYC